MRCSKKLSAEGAGGCLGLPYGGGESEVLAWGTVMINCIYHVLLITRYSTSVGMNGSFSNMQRASTALIWGFPLKTSPPWKRVLVPPLLLPRDEVPHAEDEDLCLEPGTGWSELLSQVAPLPAPENLWGNVLIVQTPVGTSPFPGSFLGQEEELLRPYFNSALLLAGLVLSWERGMEVFLQNNGIL